MTYHCYVLNLNESKARWNRMIQVGKETGLKLSRIEAVSAENLGEEKIYSEIFGRFLSSREIACFYSHRKVWKKIAESSEPFSVVFEDDVIVSSELTAFLDELSRSPFKFDLIHLEDTRKNGFYGSQKQIKPFNRTDIVPLYSPAVGAAAMIVSREGAQKLLSFETFDLPADEFIFSKYSQAWPTLLRFQSTRIFVWQLSDFPCLHSSVSQSTINVQAKIKKDKRLIASLKKNILKVRYMFALLYRNARHFSLDTSLKDELVRIELERQLPNK